MGEAVLGCGAGTDAFLAAARVGGSEKVIGVDIAADMIGKARANAESDGISKVEFRHGDIGDPSMDSGSVESY